MKQAGRVNWLVLLACIGLVLIVGLMMLSGGSAASTAQEFMLALQRRDVDKLTELSNVAPAQKEKLHKQWDFCINTATPTYNFRWQFQYTQSTGPDSEVAMIKMWKSADAPGSYDELFQIPLVKIDGTWKVDVYRMSAKFYPAIPRVNSDL